MHRNRIYYTSKQASRSLQKKDVGKAKVYELLDNFKVSSQQLWWGKKLLANNLAEY